MHNFSLTGRRWSVVLLILIVILVTVTVPALAGEKQAMRASPWVISTADSLEGGSSLSIVTDGNNRPHISYFGVESADTNAPFGLKYARWTGSKWTITYIEDVGRTVAETSIALDSQGNPHISYYSMPSRDLKYAHYDGEKWVTEVVDGTGDVGVSNSLRLDSNDLPRIAYWDDTKQDVRYARFDGTKWNFSTVEDLVCDPKSIPEHRVSLALDSKNRPHVSYHDCPTLTQLKYAVQASGAWTTEVVEEGVNSGLSSSIEVDSQDRPHISYRSGNTAGGLMYAYFDGANWQYSPRVDHDFWYGNSTSLELSTGGQPRIAYTFWPPPPDEIIPKEFRFAYLAGDQRTTELIEAADSTSIRAAIALAMDGVGNYHVAYWDDVTNQLKYAKRGALIQTAFLPLVLGK